MVYRKQKILVGEARGYLPIAEKYKVKICLLQFYFLLDNMIDKFIKYNCNK